MNEAEERRCDVARCFFAALSDGDLEAMRPMLHPDATWEVMRAVPGERLTVGRDAIIDDFLAPVRGRFAPGDPEVTVHRCSRRSIAWPLRPMAMAPCATAASTTTGTRG